MGYRYPQFLNQVFIFGLISPFLILYRQMPALTRRGKRQLPRDIDKDEDGEGEMLVGILAQRARRREAAEEQEQEGERSGNRVCHMIFLDRSTTNNIFVIFQVPSEDDLDGDGDVGRPPTPPASSPGPQEGDRSRHSSPTFSRRPAARTATQPPSPEQRMPGRSTAQRSAVGMSQPRQQPATNMNQPASSSRDSHDPPAPSAPTTLVTKSQAGKMKKHPLKRRKKNW